MLAAVQDSGQQDSILAVLNSQWVQEGSTHTQESQLVVQVQVQA